MKLPNALVWFVVVSALILQGACLWLLREAAVPVLTISIPATLALVGAGRWIDSKGVVQ